MCLTFASLFQQFFGKKQMEILMVGLDDAGKTTILYKLKLGEILTNIPAMGINFETVENKNMKFTNWGVHGQDKLRSLWHHYFLNTQGVIFVIDSNNRERVSEARDELQQILSEDVLRDAPLLIFANKQDAPHAMNAAEITDKLGLHLLCNRNWYIQAACAISGDGLHEGAQRRTLPRSTNNIQRPIDTLMARYSNKDIDVEQLLDSLSLIIGKKK